MLVYLKYCFSGLSFPPGIILVYSLQLFLLWSLWLLYMFCPNYLSFFSPNTRQKEQLHWLSFGRFLLYGYGLSSSFPPQTLLIVPMSGIGYEDDDDPLDHQFLILE